MDEKLIDAGRVVLKAEWEKVKSEMRGEGFQTGAASTPNIERQPQTIARANADTN